MTDVDGSCTPQVNDFLTNTGYDVETHEGENGQVIQNCAPDWPTRFADSVQNVSTSAWASKPRCER
jgi:hypothetical protein